MAKVIDRKCKHTERKMNSVGVEYCPVCRERDAWQVTKAGQVYDSPERSFALMPRMKVGVSHDLE